MHLSERWFDDFTIGDVFEVGPHRMTEERIISFASEFDPQTFHTDPVAAKDTLFGGLVASGWHTGSVLMKLLATTLGEASMGSSGGDELRWLAPVRPGDELTLRVTVIAKRPSETKPDRGVLIYRSEMSNQDDVKVMTFTSKMFMKRRVGGVTGSGSSEQAL